MMGVHCRYLGRLHPRVRRFIRYFETLYRDNTSCFRMHMNLTSPLAFLLFSLLLYLLDSCLPSF